MGKNISESVDSKLKDKIRGCLLGVAIGDALGAPFEHIPPGQTNQTLDKIGGCIEDFHPHWRYAKRDKRVQWVFWHRYWSSKINGWTVGPYKERKKIMRTLCKRAGVKYFRYHALRHFGASLLEQANVPIGSIQRLLGHENRATTELYLHSIGESEKQAMDALNDSFECFSHTKSHTNEKGDMT